MKSAMNLAEYIATSYSHLTYNWKTKDEIVLDSYLVEALKTRKLAHLKPMAKKIIKQDDANENEDDNLER